MCPQRSQATSMLAHDRSGVSLQERRITEVWGIGKYCCQTKIKTGINWVFLVIWNTNMIAFLGLR